MKTLFATSTKMVIKSDSAGAELNGALFAVQPGFIGIDEALFAS